MGNGELKQFASDYFPLIIVLVVWEAIWKLIAMWRAGRNNQPGWFICIALINTIGILPIAYLLDQRKSKPAA
jgi:hypothetical protein